MTRISVFIDPFRDQQRAYKLSANGYGVQSDAVLGGGGGHGGGGGGGGGGGDDFGDSSWDALYFTKGTPVADGFIVEMAIPLKSLRYPAHSNGDGHQWAFQIQRRIQGKNEDDVWAPVSRDVAGFLTQMGVLGGMRNLSTSRNLEILPTLTTVQASELDTDTGGYSKGKIDPEFGLNVKYGITSNLTTDFTYNPDFSQIESDRPQIDVNQRYPLYYEERRPFFLEGQEIFKTPINLVHTRTIVDPQYGTKLTGKIGSASVGALFAADESPGKLDEPLSASYVGQSANVFLGRVRYDLYSESHIGAIVTDREFMDQWSRSFGVDGRFRLGRTHNVTFMAAMTDSRFETENDADETIIDQGRGELGFMASYRRTGRRLSYSVTHNNLAPKFHSTLGFIRRVDIAETQGEISYKFWPQGRIISWGPRLEYTRNYDHAGHLTDEEINPSLSFEFAKNIRLDMSRSQALERYEGATFQRHNSRVGLNINTSRRFSIWANWNTGTGIYYDGEPPYVGRSQEGFLSFTLRPNSRFETSLTNNISRMADLDTAWRRSTTSGSTGCGRLISSRIASFFATSSSTTGIREARRQSDADLPRQRRHGGLRRLRRPGPPRSRNQRRAVLGQSDAAHEPDVLREDLLPVPTLTLAGFLPDP